MSLSSQVLRGAAVLTFSRIITRAFSLISILTVARWLGPEEMGVFGVATLVLAALDQLSETGLRPALIQRAGDISQYVTPVRTVQLVRGVFLGLLVFTTAPWVSGFFNSPKALEILRIIAFVPIIQGLEPILETLARKELNFKPVVKVQVVSSLVGLVVGVVSAHFQPDAWALVYSTLSRVTVSTLGYYCISERKLWALSLKWAPLKDLHTFGFWVFINSIISYLFIKGGDWVIGRMLSIEELALYQMAFLISTIITGELAGILSNLTLPLFSKLQNDQEQLAAVFCFSFGATSIVTFFMAALLCACSPALFKLVLGSRWLPALPLVPWLTAWSVCAVFAGAICGLMQALGRAKLWAQTVFVMVGLMAIGVYPMTRWLGSTGVAVLLAGIGILMQLFRYWIMARLLGRTYAQVLAHVLIPMVACLVAVTLVRYLVGTAIPSGVWASLLLSAAGTTAVFWLIIAAAGSRLQPSLAQLVERAASLSAITRKPAVVGGPHR